MHDNYRMSLFHMKEFNFSQYFQIAAKTKSNMSQNSKVHQSLIVGIFLCAHNLVGVLVVLLLTLIESIFDSTKRRKEKNIKKEERIRWSVWSKGEEPLRDIYARWTSLWPNHPSTYPNHIGLHSPYQFPSRIATWHGFASMEHSRKDSSVRNYGISQIRTRKVFFSFFPRPCLFYRSVSGWPAVHRIGGFSLV